MSGPKLKNIVTRLHYLLHMKDDGKSPKHMKRQSDLIKEISNDIMCKQADIKEFQKKLLATPAPAAALLQQTAGYWGEQSSC